VPRQGLLVADALSSLAAAGFDRDGYNAQGYDRNGALDLSLSLSPAAH